MHPLAFIGGAIVGAAGLLGAALYDSHKTESQYSPLIRTPDKLDAAGVSDQLNAYFFKAQALYSKCNQIVLENSDLIIGPVSLPWDNPVRKAANTVVAKLGKVCGNYNVHQLMECGKEANHLYRRYIGVFERANSILKERGRSPLDIPDRLFSEKLAVPDTSVSDEDWGSSFEIVADKIRDTIEASCNLAEQLIEILEQDKAKYALEAENA